MDNQQEKSTSEKIISAAKSGRLKMRPKWHFVLRATLWLAGIGIAAAALLYFFSLFVFIARETGIWMAPVFGSRGIFIFLTSLPWILILLVLIFVAVLEILVRRYAFAYRLPLLYLALTILLAVFAGGVLLAQTPLHEMLSHCPPGDRLHGDSFSLRGGQPCGTGIYRDLGPRRFENIHYGAVKRLTDSGFVLANRQRENIVVIITRKTRLPFGTQFEIGDAVVVIGDRRGDQVEAFGVSEINQ